MSVFIVNVKGDAVGVGHGARGIMHGSAPPVRTPGPVRVTRMSGPNLIIEAKGDIVGVGHGASGTIAGETKHGDMVLPPAPGTPGVFIVKTEGRAVGVGHGAKGEISGPRPPAGHAGARV